MGLFDTVFNAGTVQTPFGNTSFDNRPQAVKDAEARARADYNAKRYGAPDPSVTASQGSAASSYNANPNTPTVKSPNGSVHPVGADGKPDLSVVLVPGKGFVPQSQVFDPGGGKPLQVVAPKAAPGAAPAPGTLPPAGGPPMSAPTGLSEADYRLLLQQRGGQVFDQQNQLNQLLLQRAQGGGPSLAGAQLGAGLDQINRTATSGAAGASGQGGVLARFAAMNAASSAGAQANQTAALARVAEIQGAQHELGANLGTMGGTNANEYGTNISGQVGTQRNNIDKNQGYMNEGNKLLGTGLGIASTYGASKLGGPTDGTNPDGSGYTANQDVAPTGINQGNYTADREDKDNLGDLSFGTA